MSSHHEMHAQSSTTGHIQDGEYLSSSQELQPTFLPRNDEAAALEEVVSEGRTDVRNEGPPGPGERKFTKSNQADNPVSKRQQAAGETTGKANLVASALNIKSTSNNNFGTADSQERGSLSTRTSNRQRLSPRRLTSGEQINACEWKKRMDLICTSECTCKNSIPQREEERVSKVSGLDVAVDSWGVVANADIQEGEIVTVFGGTTCLQGSTLEGDEFSRIHAKMSDEGVPLQYTLQGHLAEANTDRIWAVPEPDKEAVRTRPGVTSRLKRAMNPGGDQGVGHLVNHTCCEEHCNAELRLTRALSGDPRIDFGDEEGAIVLMVRAKKFIKRHDTILVPRAGIESWKKIFECACCKCKGQCGPSARTSQESERKFAETVQQAQHDGVPSAREMTKGDFVSTQP
jgi:hypothetical protein